MWIGGSKPPRGKGKGKGQGHCDGFFFYKSYVHLPQQQKFNQKKAATSFVCIYFFICFPLIFLF
jgi:hypothetical protein